MSGSHLYIFVNIDVYVSTCCEPLSVLSPGLNALQMDTLEPRDQNIHEMDPFSCRSSAVYESIPETK